MPSVQLSDVKYFVRLATILLAGFSLSDEGVGPEKLQLGKGRYNFSSKL